MATDTFIKLQLVKESHEGFQDEQVRGKGGTKPKWSL